MARTSTYLNFDRCTEEAFTFYKHAFKKTDLDAPVDRMGDVPTDQANRVLTDEDKQLVMHIQLTILGGHVLMGTDAPESLGMNVRFGNNVYINLEPDTRRETDELFADLGFGGTIDMPLQEMYWGGYFGSLTDRFGVQWMFNCDERI